MSESLLFTTPCVVTRGNVDLKPILLALQMPYGINVWDNSKEVIDLKTLGLYVACGRSTTPLVYVQDDDCLVPNWIELVMAWNPGKIICNMPPEFVKAYEGKADHLMGFGALFEKSLIKPTFERYLRHFPMDSILLRESNRIFTALNRERCVVHYVGRENLPHATAPDRLYRLPGHTEAHIEALRRVDVVLEWERSHANQ